MMRVSQRLRDALKLRAPAWRHARSAGVDPTTLSKLLSGAYRLRENDRRIVAVGRELGLLPDECFESDAPGEGQPSGELERVAHA